MRELEDLLSDVPSEERIEALKYYNDYFDDAGVENETNIISELGTPERIAGIIKADLKADGGSNQDRGFFTERGYKDTVYEEEKFEVVKPGEKNQNSNSTNNTNNTNNYNTNKSNTNNTNILLVILICIFALPVGVPLFFSFFGIALSIVLAIAGILFGFAIAGIVMVPAGIAMVFAGLFKMGIPYIGLAICGGGLLILGIGILFVLLSVCLCKTVVPAIIRGIVYICRLPFKNRSVSA